MRGWMYTPSRLVAAWLVCVYTAPAHPPPRREKMQRALSLRGMNAALLARVASIIAEEEDEGGNASIKALQLRRDQAPS